MADQRIVYVCGGRNFWAEDPIRKIGGVVACWKKAGHQVMHVCGGDISCNYNASKKYGALGANSRPYRCMSFLQPVIHSLSEHRDILHDRLMLRHLELAASEWSPTLVWERSCRLHFAGLAFANKIGIPYVLEWKDHLVSYGASVFKRRAKKVESLKNAKADFIVVESEVLRGCLARENVSLGKILVAHNAVDADVFVHTALAGRKWRNTLGVGDSEVLVGYLGSYAFYHDALRLVLAAEILSRMGLGGIRILMVGNGKEFAECQKAAREKKLLGSKINMHPGVAAEEVPALLSALDVAVLPGSTDIICPIKVQEYMAAGLPTVVPDYPCNREVIVNGRTGILFVPKNEFSLAGALELLAGDANLRTRLGIEARAEVERRFSWEATWGATLNEILRRIDQKKRYVGSSQGVTTLEVQRN